MSSSECGLTEIKENVWHKDKQKTICVAAAVAGLQQIIDDYYLKY